MGIDIKTLQTCYRGFWIDQPRGNNAFSFQQRKHRKIYVAPLISGEPGDLAVGEEIAFSEVNEGQEVNCRGLKQFIYLQKDGKDIFIFDNHNHAFFFWMAGLKAGKLKKGGALVHVDQHRDMREPETYFEWGAREEIEIEKVCQYTNFHLNVGNFIRPALKLGIFSTLEIIDSSTAFQREFSAGIVLDIDADIFAEEMNYIARDYKIARLRRYIAAADFITIASSPYFIQQESAIGSIRQLLEEP